MTQFFAQNGGIILRLVVAIGLGMVIGAERLLVHKEAGMKTHALVAMGSALFVIVSEYLYLIYSSVSGFNPAIIASNIIVGIGFLGAGSIIFHKSRLTGLTTAGGLWVTAGIGMATGFGLFSLAAISTLLVLIIFIVVNVFEKPIRRIAGDEELNK
ncbi:MgtC/SapB family protein [Patescibacteria group bacterium]|nr:MgtC/SapB family protein [Patescibacteria group bacterium]MBU1728257.1 MgtC/SapB family protein [Patescibacteria group bacterium]